MIYSLLFFTSEYEVGSWWQSQSCLALVPVTVILRAAACLELADLEDAYRRFIAVRNHQRPIRIEPAILSDSFLTAAAPFGDCH